MYSKRVAVLRGGPSEEYSVSMNTGRAVLESLSRQNIFCKDIIITKNGEWINEGKVMPINKIFEGIDIVFLALHGSFSEDGEIQKMLQTLKIPFTGSSSLSSAIAFNKALTKDIVEREGVLTPKYKVITNDQLDDIYDITNQIISDIGPEYMVKPNTSGSSISTQLVRNSVTLQTVIEDTLKKYDSIIVEEFIRGKEATVAVLEDFRGEEIYTFPITEIIPSRKFPFFDYQAKYSGETETVCPSSFSYRERVLLQDYATHIHKTLGLSQYSRSDFMVRDNKVYFLETNTLPGLTSESLYPKAAKAVGLEFDDLISHLLNTCAK